MENLELKIDTVFRKVMGLEDDFELNDDMSSETLDEWGSMESMMLTVELEKALEIKFSFDEILEMSSLGSIKQLIFKKLG